MKKQDSMSRMGTEPIGKLMLSMGIPMILSMVLVMIMISRASAERIVEVLDEQVDIVDAATMDSSTYFRDSGIIQRML